MKKKAQPKKKPSQAVYEIKDLRMTKDEWEEVTRAAQAEAAARHIPYSRNNYCVRAVLAAARKKVGDSE